jgi:hypothetical protein
LKLLIKSTQSKSANLKTASRASHEPIAVT